MHATATIEARLPKVAASSHGSPYQFAAWLVDLDGTLYHQAFVRAMMAAELVLWGRSAIKILTAFRREQERMRADRPPGVNDPFQRQIERTAERLAIRESDVAAVVDRWMIERPGRWLRICRRRTFLSAVAEYRTRGGKTAIVSDYPARRKLAALRAEALFDVIVACGEPGCTTELKPNPLGLTRAAEQLGVRPVDCLVIGDRPTVDGEAARRAGMAFRHVNNRWHC